MTPGSRALQPGWRPLDPVDRSWSGIGYIRAFLDLDMPPASAIRAALRELSALPEIGRWQTMTPPRWRPLHDGERAGWLDAVLRTDDGPADADHAFAVNAEPLGDEPFRVVLGPDWISIRMTHATGDGWTVNALIGHLLRRAASDADDARRVPWTVVASSRRDRLIVRDVVTRPRTVAWAVRHRQELAGGRYEPLTDRAAAMRERTLALVSGPDFLTQLRAVRADLFPSASAAAVAMVGFRAALATTLPEPLPGFECLFNTRGAEGDTATSWGNWSVGVYLHPADDYSPLATAQAMTHARDIGLPGLATASLRARARGATGETVSLAAPEGAPRLTLSYTQSHAMAGLLPGERPGRTSVITLTRPNGVETIAVHALELAGRLSVSTAFYPDAWDAAAVESALTGFLADPARYFERLRSDSGGARR